MVKIYLCVKTCGDEKCLVISLKCTEILIGMPCHFIKGFFIFYIGTKIRLKIMFFALDLLWNRKFYICYYNTQIKHNQGYNIELGGENREIRGTSVCQFSLKGEKIQEFPTIASAAKATNTIPSGITLCCNKQRRFSNNYQWCYTKDEASFLGTIPKEQAKTSKAVIQYDDEDNIIKIWESATQAAKELAIPRQHIYKVCKGERKHCGGYRWRYCKEEDNTPRRKKTTNKGKPVKQFSKNGVYIKEYSSIREAEKSLGIKPGKSKIYEVCQNKRKTCYGYIWRYKNEI